MQFGQPLFGFSQFTPGQVDLLATLAGSGALTVVQGTESGSNAYTALCVVVKGTTRQLYCVAVNPADENTTPRMWSAPAHTIDFGASIYQQCIVPVQLGPGEAFDFTCYFNGNNSDAVVVYGITGPVNIPVRADGRAYPLGRHAATAVAAGVMIPGLVSPLRVFIQSVQIGGTGTAALQAALDGVVSDVIICPQAGNVVVQPPGGILVDAASSVTLAGGAGPIALVNYDIIA